MEFNNNLPSFGDLPLIIIEHILDYLPLYDRNCASLTCHQWYIASTHPRLRKNVELSLHKTIFPVDLILASSTIYENIRLDRVTLENDLPFWQNCGSNIKQLIINNCNLEYEKFIEILNFLPSLEELELGRCYTLTEKSNFLKFDLNQIPIGLTNLKSLRFVCNENFTGKILRRITRFTHSLEEFVCSENIQLGKLRLLDSFNFLNFYRHTLKTLHISKDFCDNLFENGPFNIDELDLTKLSIDSDEVPQTIDFICSQKNLKTLDLTVDYLSRDEMKLICDSLIKLESFRLEFIDDQISSEGIKNLKNLKAFYLFVMTPIDLIRQAVGMNCNEQLQILDITVSMIEEPIKELFINLPNLREFSITFDRLELDVFQLIFKYLLNLEVLQIDWSLYNEPPPNELIYDTELYDIGRLTKLKCLKLYFPGECIHGFTLVHLMQLKNLKELTFYQCEPAITVAEQINLMKSLRLLEEIDFSKWNGIESDVIRANGQRLRNTTFQENSSFDLSEFAESGRPYT